MADWLYSDWLPVLLDGLTVTDSDGDVAEIQLGEVEFTEWTKRTATRWAAQVPLGNTTPTRRLAETPRAEITIRGDLVAGRFSAGAAHLRALEALIGQTVTLLWHADRTTGSYTVDAVDLRWRYGHGLPLGCEFTLRFTEAAAPTVAAPTGRAPAFSGLVGQQFTIGQPFGPLIISATVPLGAQAAGGYWMSVTGLPAGIAFTAPNSIGGTPAATAVAGDAKLTIHDPDGNSVATGTLPFVVA